MTFLNPGYLWGLLAISIPIIIHLFNFRRVRKVNFPNIALLKAVNTQAKTFLRLKQWLVLATRILFISSLVLAFAQPFIPSKSGNQQDSRSITSIYLDNSASMQNETDNKSAINTAIKKIDRLATEIPKSAKSQFVTNDFTSNEFKTFSPSELRNEASKVEISASVRSLPDVFDRQINLVNKNTSSQKNNFFLFSDFQKSTSGNLSEISKDAKNNIYLVPSNTTESHNVYVDSVWLDNPFIRKMQPNGLNVRLSNSGNEAVKNLPIKLHLGDLQMNSIPTKIEANASVNVHFELSINQNGYQKGKISFEDNPVLFDNEYYFVLNASPVINVIHLYGGTFQNNYLKNVFSNDSLFKYSAFPLLNVDFGIVKNADLLIVEGASEFSSNSSQAINGFLQNGGSVFVIPSKNAKTESYNSLLNKFGIANITENTDKTGTLNSLEEPQRQSAFFKDIFENSKIKDRMMMPNTSQLLKWYTLGDVLLKSKGNQNYLTVSKSQKGSVYFMASPLSEEYSNLPQNALFVPIMYKIAALSIKPSQLAYRFDEKAITFENKNYTDKSVFKLRKDGFEMIPTQRVVNNELYFELPKPNEFDDARGLQSGYYEFLSGNNLEKILAFNHSNVESKMETYSTNELKQIFSKNKNIHILDQENSADFLAEYKAQNQGNYFWKYLIIAALLFLAIEILIIRFWKN
jgi:Aerotolerance regulator N-terminal